MKLLRKEICLSSSNLQQGFTLLETLIVLTLTAILLSIATPSFYAYSAQSESKAITQKLAGLVRLARNNAINHQSTTLMCASEDGLACTENWQKGVLIFEDENHDKQVNDTEATVYFQQALAKNGSLRWTALHNHLSFSSEGLSGTTAGSFIYCPEDKNPKYANALIVSFTGKVRQAIDSNHDGIRESGNNKNILCP